MDDIKEIDILSDDIHKLAEYYTKCNIEMFKLASEYHNNRMKILKNDSSYTFTHKDYPSLEKIIEDSTKLFRNCVWSHNDIINLIMQDDEHDIVEQSSDNNSLH